MPPPRRQRLRRDVEGLRAVAVLAVVLYHAGVPGVRGGYVGVDVFFVVSGFLITGLLWRELADRRRIARRAFYARRARRLLPASVLVLVVTLLAARAWWLPLELPAVGGDGLAAGLYVVNYRFALLRTSYLTATAPSPLQHYWSLSVEEQFYALWPVVVAVAGVGVPWRARRRDSPPSRRRTIAVLALVGAVSLAASAWITLRSQPWAFFSLPTRAWEFVVGALVALAEPATMRLPIAVSYVFGWLGLASIMAAVVAFSGTTPFPGLAALVPVLGTAAVIAAGSRWGGDGPVSVLRPWPMQVLGRISYSWYLWHWPALILLPAALRHSLGLGARLGVVAAGAGLAMVTLVVVENPIRSARPLAATPARGLSLAVVLTMLAAGTGVVVRRTPPPGGAGTGAGAFAVAGAAARLPYAPAGPSASSGAPPAASPTATTVAPTPLQAATATIEAAVAASLQATDVPADLTPALGEAHSDRAAPFDDGCFDGFADTAVHRCTYGSAGATTTVALFGDSHAVAWSPAFAALAAQRSWRLLVYAKATCPPLDASVYAPNLGRTYRECDRWRRAALARLQSEHPQLVVLAMNRAYGDAYHLQPYGATWLQGLDGTVLALRQAGSDVMVIGPLPHPPDDVPDCLAAHVQDRAACNQIVAETFDAGGLAAERAAVEASGGYYLDVRPWLCDATYCAAVVGNLLVYRDENHLTTAFAAWLAPAVAAAADEAITNAVAHP